MKNDYFLIYCADCREDGCTVACSASALAFFHGNIMIEAAKCAICAKWEGAGVIPSCVSGCKKSADKKIIEETDAKTKRKNACEALSLR
jgi:Fe-S-cluster-containing dehydrogenase component